MCGVDVVGIGQLVVVYYEDLVGDWVYFFKFGKEILMMELVDIVVIVVYQFQMGQCEYVGVKFGKVDFGCYGMM